MERGAPCEAWGEGIAAGRLAVHRGVALAPEDRLRRAVIERLMCDMRADLAQLARAHGFPETAFATETAALAPMVADGLAEVAGSVVRIPEAGRFFMRTVAAVFDGYLGSGQGRHSRAV